MTHKKSFLRAAYEAMINAQAKSAARQVAYYRKLYGFDRDEETGL